MSLRRFHSRRFAVWLVPALIALLVAAAHAAPSTQDLAALIVTWNGELGRIERAIDSPTVSDADLAKTRDGLEDYLDESKTAQSAEAPVLDAARNDLAMLGPPPAAGQPPEPSGVAFRRLRLTEQIADLDGELKEIDLLTAHALRIQNRIAVARRDRFERHLLQWNASPLLPDVWARLWTELTAVHASSAGAIAKLFAAPDVADQLWQSGAIILSILVLASLLMWPLRRWLLKRYGRDASIAAPSYLQLVRAMVVVTVARAVLPTLTAAIVYVFILNEDILSDAGRVVARSVFLAFLLFTWSLTLVRAALAPANPAWRILSVPTRFVKSFWGVSAALALIFSLDVVSSALIETFDVRLEITIVRDFLLTFALVALLLSLLLRRALWKADASTPPRWRWQRALASLALLATLGVSIAGYVSLGRFIALQIFFGGGLVLLLLVVRKVVQDLIDVATSSDSWFVRRRGGQDADFTRGRFWLGVLVDLVLIGFGALIEAFLWGADWQDVQGAVSQAVSGVRIGELTISIGDLASAAAIFALAVFATRFVQRALAQQILPQTRLDRGLQNSIRVGAGYLGFTLAAVFAISALGLNLSNLAIVAGALSVGIGFGLQTVVNNFVSGLILLVERPIKIGDWIKVGDVQGYVRKISVRATQVETFAKATVFIPNSELTSTQLTNLTHPDATGRLNVPIGVAYGTDLAAACALLLDIAKKNKSLLSYPAPAAVVRGFGDSAINLEVIGYMADVANVYAITSDLCIAIDKAFRAAGIEIPFPQRDIHIRSTAEKTPGPKTPPQ